MAHPEHRIGIEYDGEEHGDPRRVRRDTGRATDLVDLGWRLHRHTEDDHHGRADTIVAQIERALRTPR